MTKSASGGAAFRKAVELLLVAAAGVVSVTCVLDWMEPTK